MLTETGVEAVAVPRTTFDELIAKSPTFRRFVFTAFEVISRQLNEFPRRSWIVTSGGAIDVVNAESLRKLAAAP